MLLFLRCVNSHISSWNINFLLGRHPLLRRRVAGCVPLTDKDAEEDLIIFRLGITDRLGLSALGWNEPCGRLRRGAKRVWWWCLIHAIHLGEGATTSKPQPLISSDCLSPWRTHMNNVHIFSFPCWCFNCCSVWIMPHAHRRTHRE